MLTETPENTEQKARFVTRVVYARLAGVSPVAIHKQVKRKLASAYANGTIDLEAPEAVAYLKNRTATRTALGPRSSQAPSCPEIRAFRSALKRWQQARALAVQAESAVLVAAQHVLERFGGQVEAPASQPEQELELT